MKKNFLTYRVQTDVLNIEIGAINAEINVVSTTEPVLFIEYAKAFAPSFNEAAGKVTLTQKKKAFSRFKVASATVYVPECNVPDVRIVTQRGKLCISGGIYGDVQAHASKLKAEINAATFENLMIKADELDVSAGEITVKNIANTLAADGRVEIDKAFCRRAECRVKKGNIGLCNYSCDFVVLNFENGNIAANILGCESDYTVNLAGAAVSGKDNLSASGRSIRASAMRGSIVLDFENGPKFDERFENLADEEVSV